MGYSLGVDLGNTYVAAAVNRGSEIEMCTLGERSLVMPSVVYIGEDGTLQVGDPAVRRGLTQPEQVVCGLRRRLTDPAPVTVGGRPHTVPELLAALLSAVLTKVTAHEGAPPERVVLARPAAWDRERCTLFDEVARIAGLHDVRTVPEPEATLMQYAASRHLADASVTAVYDLGGGTFDVSLMRKVPGGVELVGQPQGIERLGGLDFDEALVDFVDDSLGGRLGGLAVDDPGSVRALARLRQQCEHAKEALTGDDMVDMPVSIGPHQLDARVSRTDLESVIRSHIESTVRAVHWALGSAQMSATQLDGILLVGGSSRIPLVARTLAEAFGCPIRRDVNPKNLVALGAAASTGARPSVGRSVSPVPSPPPPPAVVPTPPTPASSPPVGQPSDVPPPMRTDPEGPHTSITEIRRFVILLSLGAILGIAVLVAFVALTSPATVTR